jgi:hypothetical protein
MSLLSLKYYYRKIMDSLSIYDIYKYGVQTGGIAADDNSKHISVLTFNQGVSKSKEYITDGVNKLIDQWRSELMLVGSRLPDVVVIAVQEALNNYVMEAFVDKLSGYTLHKKSKEQLQLGKMTLLLFYKNDNNMILEMQLLDSMNCSFHNPAKGAIFTRFYIQFNRKIFLFVIFNAHLPSDPRKPHDRNVCINKLIEQNVTHNDIVIFAGDLNYRVSTEKTTPEMRAAIDSHVCSGKVTCQKTSIFKCADEDQLSKSLGSSDEPAPLKNTELIESDINFCQTCRFSEITDGSHTIKQQKYDSKRIPSWCDRVLYRIPKQYQNNITPAIYNSFRITPESDHMAVYHHFILN